VGKRNPVNDPMRNSCEPADFFVLLLTHEAPIKQSNLRPGGEIMRGFAISLFIAVALMLLAVDASAQLAIRRAGGGGWGATTQYGQKFNPNTLETHKGAVLSIEKFTPLRKMAYGYLVKLQTAKEAIEVHIGPGWYVSRQVFEIVPEDTIIVKGSRIDFLGKQVIMATEVWKGSERLLLRDETGMPVWSEFYKKPSSS
jgi:hypothetical protein